MDGHGITAIDLASRMRVTYQAVKKVLDGKSKAFGTENNSAAAIILDVDPDWLATGKGHASRSTQAANRTPEGANAEVERVEYPSAWRTPSAPTPDEYLLTLREALGTLSAQERQDVVLKIAMFLGAAGTDSRLLVQIRTALSGPRLEKRKPA